MKKIPKPTTAYLDDSEPLLKIPIWRGCAATRKSDKDLWMPAIMGDIESQPDSEKVARSAEEDQAFTQLVKKSIKDVPWVKAAARVVERQGKAKKKKAAFDEENEQV